MMYFYQDTPSELLKITKKKRRNLCNWLYEYQDGHSYEKIVKFLNTLKILNKISKAGMPNMREY